MVHTDLPIFLTLFVDLSSDKRFLKIHVQKNSSEKIQILRIPPKTIKTNKSYKMFVRTRGKVRVQIDGFYEKCGWDVEKILWLAWMNEKTNWVVLFLVFERFFVNSLLLFFSSTQKKHPMLHEVPKFLMARIISFV